MDPVIERFLVQNGTDPVPFSTFMDFALYDERFGFYTAARSARSGRAGGRSGDFLTSPEVGPLFGALVAERIDREWDAAGRPGSFAVVECGAGPGTLARSVALASPRCSSSLRYLMVEVSEAQRLLHGDHLAGWSGDLSGPEVDAFVGSLGDGPCFASAASMPTSLDGLVLANELLDNLPFDIVRHDGRGGVERLDVAVGDSTDDVPAFDFVPRPATLEDDEAAVVLSAPAGAWLPLQRVARAWVRDVLDRIGHGALVVLDYGATTAEIAARADMGWLRTFADNDRSGHPLDEPGTRDITADVAIDQLSLDRAPSSSTAQRDWSIDLGIDALVEEGRRLWSERAAAPDLIALRGRSRVGESEALLDPQGLGGFVVLEWHVRGTDRPRPDR